MSLIYAFSVSALMGVGIYLMLSRHLMRMLFGVVILSTAANLLIFVSGGLQAVAPPIIQGDMNILGETAANPLPQALILTAIVIGFALVAFAAALVLKAYGTIGSVFTDDQNDAERLGSPFYEEGPRNG
ncbi:NADH-quinone oxidoreductase subunit K [Pararhizobium haloflavum]|uniref:NADH-quinone oxidoreductase subunit K n=1 Tax=Pararhizobium haloflavum TaxID=2037914 RepID=UPI000C18538F|nr:NADH-quinone oxidoreductase subunit K [Pararhizobium haloflavum]